MRVANHLQRLPPPPREPEETPITIAPGGPSSSSDGGPITIAPGGPSSGGPLPNPAGGAVRVDAGHAARTSTASGLRTCQVLVRNTVGDANYERMSASGVKIYFEARVGAFGQYYARGPDLDTGEVGYLKKSQCRLAAAGEDDLAIQHLYETHVEPYLLCRESRPLPGGGGNDSDDSYHSLAEFDSAESNESASDDGEAELLSCDDHSSSDSADTDSN